MPVLTQGTFKIDYFEQGRGPAVVLLHSSVTGNQQWQGLASTLREHRRVIAPNLFGYGETSPWVKPPAQKISDQAALVCAVLEGVEGPIDLVGHSFGALIALEVASMMGERVGRLVMFEPNPFALLDRPGCEAEFAEVRKLYAQMTHHSLCGEWSAVAKPFADFFSGEGAWAAMPAERRSALAASLGPTAHEWDAVMDPQLSLLRWKNLKIPALLMWARDTRPALLRIAKLLRNEYPSWSCGELERGGHMAPINRPRVFYNYVESFLGLA
jgi:pimeloyl-ACP methyl ester carboxylesterase